MDSNSFGQSEHLSDSDFPPELSRQDLFPIVARGFLWVSIVNVWTTFLMISIRFSMVFYGFPCSGDRGIKDKSVVSQTFPV